MCQIDNDGTMVIRMFEYDMHIALNYIREKEDGMELKFPHSAVLYLQNNGKIPDELTCQIRFQKNMKAIQRQEEKGKKEKLVTRQKEELSFLYEQIMLILEEEVANGYLSETNRKTIISLLGKSMIRVFYRNEERFKNQV